ncbi:MULTISPECIES: Hpt domain-containing protein [unclassified Mesorhizobium]|uniref:Hpt domain-containing protein n=1 Tax=unclassified Mesorhizobium TaxID=325217 RepID=UPI00112BE783|nr:MULTISPECIES: Hpt domain-containing protein [unclassified Mesorhizobium]TPI58857.1 Hpt domain-containing protein [Mesorhizobium sp. B3-1-7]TPJ32216.1 Hpt domain-containing protein [Mesorhizobium sp. B2-8-3]
MAIDKGALDKLRELVGGEEADLVELVESFLEEGPSIMLDMWSSARASDLAVTRRAAHSLKSNARDMGAAELSQICAQVEARCASGEPTDLAEIDNAQRAFDAAVTELRKIFKLGE